MSRVGKIARLPRAVREELNWRLLDGEQQSRLVEWLNGREEVQAMLKAEFDGRPLNEPNLTAWMQGGFEDWRRQQESREAADRLVEESSELNVMAKDRGLADRAADMAALAMAEQLMAIRRMEEGEEKRRAVLKIVRGLVRLRKSERDCERAQREAAQAERAAEIHEDWVERMRPRGRSPFDRLRATLPRRTEVGGRRMRERGDPLSDVSDEELMRRMEELRSLGPVRQVPNAQFRDSCSPSREPVSLSLRSGQGDAAASDGGETAEHDYDDDYEHEDEVGDVRERMEEVLAGMSDEEIAEILRKGGYMSPSSAKPSTSAKPTADRTEGRLTPEFAEAWAPDGTWWSEEDEAAYQAEEEEEAEGARSTGLRANATFGGEAVPTTSTMVGQPVAGITSNDEGPSSSNLPPEGGTTNVTEHERGRTEGGPA